MKRTIRKKRRGYSFKRGSKIIKVPSHKQRYHLKSFGAITIIGKNIKKKKEPSPIEGITKEHLKEIVPEFDLRRKKPFITDVTKEVEKEEAKRKKWRKWKKVQTQKEKEREEIAERFPDEE